MWRAYTVVNQCVFDQIPNLQNCFTLQTKHRRGGGLRLLSPNPFAGKFLRKSDILDLVSTDIWSMLYTNLQEGLAAGERASHLPTGRQYHLQAQLSQRESGTVLFLLFLISVTNFLILPVIAVLLELSVTGTGWKVPCR